MSEGCVDEESEFAAEGTVAHTLGEHCLTEKMEPWQMIGTWCCPAEEAFTPDAKMGQELGGTEVSKDMADAVQSYLTLLDQWHPERNQGNSWVERRFHCPSIHKLFYGTADFVYLDEHPDDGIVTLHVWDYKHGAGIVVEVEGNAQCMYYAAGALEDLGMWGAVDRIVIHIVQPRGWHMDGPHRTWELTTDELDAWLSDQLVPAMDVALVSRDTRCGDWCRFCPARGYACPSIMEALEEVEELINMTTENMTSEKITGKEAEAQAKEGAAALSNEQLGRLMDLQALSKIVFKAAGAVAFKKLSAGAEVPGTKLVKSRTNREFKKGAEAAAKKQFKGKAYAPPRLKSPAEFDGMPTGKAFTARWGFKPEGKVTVATEGDPRRRVNRNAKSLFSKQGN